MTDPNLIAAQQTIDDLQARISVLSNRPSLNLKDVVKKAIAGWNGKLGAHVMPWFGDGKTHRVNRYKSNDPAVVVAQVNAMQAVGIDFVVLTWQGKPSYSDSVAELLIADLDSRGMQFAYLLDPWIAKGKPNPTQAVIDQLSSVASVLNSGVYLKHDGKPLVCEFSLGQIGVDVAKVQQAHPELNILSWHTGYSWPNIAANGFGSLATLKADHAKPSVKIASLNLAFNDAGYPLPDGSRDYCHEVWDKTKPARVIDHQAGNWFHDQLKTIPATVPYVAVVTWNDHDEGTGIEQFVSMLTGIRIGA